jgi:hypothetical protein
MHRKSSYVNEKYGSLYGGQTILHKCICALLRFLFSSWHEKKNFIEILMKKHFVEIR